MHPGCQASRRTRARVRADLTLRPVGKGCPVISSEYPVPPPDDDAGPAVWRDRERIAAELRNEVVRRVYSVGLSLQSAAAIAVHPLVRSRVEQAIEDLDDVIRVLRDAVFGLDHQPGDRGLRARILFLCEQLSPAPDVSFRGPVDGALPPGTSNELLEVLHEALGVIAQHWTPVRIDLTADDGGALAAMIDATAPPAPRRRSAHGDELARLRASAARAGMRVEIESGREAIRFAWHAC